MRKRVSHDPGTGCLLGAAMVRIIDRWLFLTKGGSASSRRSASQSASTSASLGSYLNTGTCCRRCRCFQRRTSRNTARVMSATATSAAAGMPNRNTACSEKNCSLACLGLVSLPDRAEVVDGTALGVLRPLIAFISRSATYATEKAESVRLAHHTCRASWSCSCFGRI